MTSNPFFRMKVDDVFSIKGRGTIVTGKIERGAVRVGDEVYVNGDTGHIKTTVTGIEVFRKTLDEAKAGDTVGIMLKDLSKTDVRKGDILSGALSGI
jgi:elongation factor Tu